MRLSKIRSEYLNRNRISTDHLVDAEAAKTVSDKLCQFYCKNISGFIQEISLNPFGALFLSDIQVLS